MSNSHYRKASGGTLHGKRSWAVNFLDWPSDLFYSLAMIGIALQYCIVARKVLFICSFDGLDHVNVCYCRSHEE